LGKENDGCVEFGSVRLLLEDVLGPASVYRQEGKVRVGLMMMESMKHVLSVAIVFVAYNVRTLRRFLQKVFDLCINC